VQPTERAAQDFDPTEADGHEEPWEITPPAPGAETRIALWVVVGVGLLLFLGYAMSPRSPRTPSVPPTETSMPAGNELVAAPEPSLPIESPEPASTTYRTSFDCLRAIGEVETTICSSADLAAADRSLADLYRQRLRAASGADASALRSSQRGWRVARGQCAGRFDARECLARLYASRIAELRDHAARPPQEDAERVTDALPELPPPPPYEDSPPVSAARPAQLRSGSISGDDYPRAALASRAQGTTVVQYTVGPGGRVVDCVVVQSSGHSALDTATCSLIQRRFRFRPAIGQDGKPASETRTQRIVWRLP
ncbi:MAG: periplasmic protein TonB, partial [Sphingomonadales bacterium]|nr:periplasmic protein TonB [Sphingomonadales bacterium]